MKIGLALLATLPAFAASPPSSLQFAQVSNASVGGVLALPNGNLAEFGSTVDACPVLQGCTQAEAPLLVVVDVSGNPVGQLPFSTFGGGNSIIASAAVDAGGNIWVTGETDSDDFPLVNALYSKKADYKQTGFVAKLDPMLNVLFSTFLGGQQIPASGLSTPVSIAVDVSGNAFVGGYTTDPNFPVTGATFGEGGPGSTGTAPVYYTFVTKISATGSQLIFSRLLGGNKSLCVGGSSCLSYVVSTMVSSIAVDTNDNVTVAGGTDAPDFPVTAGAGQSGGAFITRISADGSQLIWSVELGVNGSFPGLQTTFSSAQSIALDNSGNVYVTGTAPGPIMTTAGAVQPTYRARLLNNGFAAKLSSDGTQLLFATNLSGMNGSKLTGLALDPAGNVWIAGNTSSPDFPGLNNPSSRSLDFVLELNTNATALQTTIALIPGTVTASPVFDSNGNLALAASAGNVLRLNPSTALSAPAVFALTNSAIPRMTAGVARGELATIYGVGLGPASGVAGAPDQNGLFPTQLGGVTVQFGTGVGSVLAPLLYVSSDQINFQAPFNLITTPIVVTLVTPAGSLPVLQLQFDLSLGIFGVVNQDGTVNGASNPAPEGSIVSLYATGLGAPSQNAQNGTISPTAVNAFGGIVEVHQQSGPLGVLPVLYAGTAPGLINGLDQVNVQLPANSQNPQLEITTLTASNGSSPAASNTVVVYTK